jgi:hypothetical protein
MAILGRFSAVVGGSSLLALAAVQHAVWVVPLVLVIVVIPLYSVLVMAVRRGRSVQLGSGLLSLRIDGRGEDDDR